MTAIDLSNIEQGFLSLLAALLLALASAVAKRVFTKLGLQVTDAQQDALNDMAHKSVSYGIGTATAEIKAKGWDHIDVKNAVAQAAGQYAVTQFPGLLKQAGIDMSNPAATASMLSAGIMTRVFPDAVSRASFSPATPPADLVSTPPGTTTGLAALPPTRAATAA